MMNYNDINNYYNIDHLQELVSRNDPVGQARLGACYYNGRGVAKDINRAFELFTLSSNQNHPLGQSHLGVCYNNGRGVAKDINRAFELFTLSSNQNHPLGQSHLGVCYYNGFGVAKDRNRAFELFTLSSNQGCITAQSNLGMCYERGMGVEKNSLLAVGLYIVSDLKGCPLGKTRLEQLFNNKDIHTNPKVYRLLVKYNHPLRYDERLSSVRITLLEQEVSELRKLKEDVSQMCTVLKEFIYYHPDNPEGHLSKSILLHFQQEQR